MTKAKKVAGAADGTVPVRVLIDHGEHKSGELAELDAAAAAVAVAEGWADDDGDAVAYARSLRAD